MGEEMRFFVGMHQPCDAGKVQAAFVSVNRLRKRKGRFPVNDWIMDSGAFSTILTHGGYPDPPEAYAAEIRRWAHNGNLLAAVAQDYMCEAHMLAITGKTIEEHQQLTVERYDALTACDTGGVYIMPVLQGYAPEDYVRHIEMYGDRLSRGMWVGVGSVCKRNGDPVAIEEVLLAVKRARPDLQLHGFGIKTTALQSGLVRDLLATADSMAWSFAARKQGRNANDWREAAAFRDRIETMPVQHSLLARSSPQKFPKHPRAGEGWRVLECDYSGAVERWLRIAGHKMWREYLGVASKKNAVNFANGFVSSSQPTRGE